MWQGKSVSVILMTYAERGSIRATIEGFLLPASSTRSWSSTTTPNLAPARKWPRPRPRGLRAATGLRLGLAPRLAEATGDLLVLAEPDGTFLPRDIGKLLAYSDECEAVFGTRTTRSLIWSGANMGLLLKWGNWAVAKLVEALFNTSHLSDVGCTYKLLHRSLAQRLLPELRVGGLALRSRADAGGHHLRGALRGGAGQLPAAGGHLGGDRRSAQSPRAGSADDRLHPAVSAQDAGQDATSARVGGPG